MRRTVKSIVDTFGTAIIMTVMGEHRIGEKEFRKSKRPAHVLARSIAIHRLSDAGFSEQAISRIMDIDPTTVAYWKRPKDRARRVAYRAKSRMEASA